MHRSLNRITHIGIPLGLLPALVIACSPADSLSAAEATFQAGAATADLTPGKGVLMDGAISKIGPMKGVHDRLKARALVLSDGQTTIALVINDMCMIDRHVYNRAKQTIAEQIGIPADNMLMAATHSHATPRVMRIGRGPANREYRSLVAERIAAAVVAAYRNRAPAKIGFGSFDLPDSLACRRFLCKPGSVGPNPFGETDERVKSVAGSSSEILRPAGPVDPQVSVLSVQHTDGSPLAVLNNFSVHYCGGYERGQVSADYFGAFARRLAERVRDESDKPPFVALMSNGTSGNTGAFRVNVEKRGPWIRIQRAGNLMAEKTRELLQTIEHQVPQTLAVATSAIELNVRKPDSERLTRARKLLDDPEAETPHRWSRIYARETVHLAAYPDHYDLELQAIRIDGIGIAAIPCEVFAETGLAIKKRSPLEHTFTIGLANGYSGYLPTPRQHEWGGYETWPARTSHLEVQAEPKIRSEVLQLLQKTAAADTDG